MQGRNSYSSGLERRVRVRVRVHVIVRVRVRVRVIVRVRVHVRVRVSPGAIGAHARLQKAIGYAPPLGSCTQPCASQRLG